MRNLTKFVRNFGFLLFVIVTLGIIHISEEQVSERWLYLFGKYTIGFMVLLLLLTEFIKAKLSQGKERKYHIINGVLLLIIVGFEIIQYFI